MTCAHQKNASFAARLIAVFASILVSTISISVLAKPEPTGVSSSSSAQFCRATEDYLAQTKTSTSSDALELDFSCLADLPAISTTLSSYQLIDSRRNQQPDSSLSAAWKMPVAQLKTKDFLKKRQLLLIGDGFSRASAASDCAILKKAGFQNIKILVGGVDVWHLYKRNVHLPADTSLKTVSAQQVLHEYFNNKVVLIASSSTVSAQLKEIGLEHHAITSFPTADKITQIVVASSGDGFYPVVIVSGENFVTPHFNSPFSNLYELAGGIETLREQMQKNMLTNQTRSAVPKRFICGNS